MKDTGSIFQSIIKNMTAKHKDVSFGKMMSSPALKYKNKVFAFYWKDSMTFKSGEDFDPKSLELTKVELLNHFIIKGPLKGWYVIKNHDANKWQTLVDQALQFIQSSK